MGEVVRKVLEEGKKTLLLGGGGYNNINAAKCWTYLTAIAVGALYLFKISRLANRPCLIPYSSVEATLP